MVIETDAVQISTNFVLQASHGDGTQSFYHHYNNHLDWTLAAVISVFICAGVAALIVIFIGIFFCCRYYKDLNMQKDTGDSTAEDYSSAPAYESYYPEYDKPPNVDRKLAESAQMFHYQHQKQQMLELERASQMSSKSEDGQDTSEDEMCDSPYTVYECPGLAAGGEIEVSNPLYNELALIRPPPPPYEEVRSVPSAPQLGPPLVNGHQK